MNRDDTIKLQNRFMLRYKKNTIAVFLSFVLTITLITALLILLHTNFTLENIQWQRLFTPSDCSVDEITKEQVEQLKEKDNVSWCAVEQSGYEEYQKNSQSILLNHGDDTFLTLTGRLEEGRLPKNQNEVVAERWTLMNMGVVPEVGCEFDIDNTTGNPTKTVKLVGILSDQPANKKYGVKILYTTLDKSADDYSVYLKFQNGTNYDEAVGELQKELDLNKKQIKACPGKMDKTKLFEEDCKIMGVLILVSLIVFYGIYHIGMMSRGKQYGILHAIGMTRKQIRHIILLEVFEIYGMSIFGGVGLGYAIAMFVKSISGDSDKDIYLKNTKVDYANIFPITQIAICVVVIAFFVGVIGYLESRKVERESIVRLLNELNAGAKKGCQFVKLKEGYSRNRTLFSMGMKYILRDWKTAIFVILTISVGITLFTGLSYKQIIAETSREDTKEMFYLNGQYEMSSMWISSPLQGISRKNLSKVNSMKAVRNVKTQAGMPVRLVKNDSVAWDKQYYEDLNKRKIENGSYPIMGNDGVDDVYQTILYGYNDNALKEMKKYIVEGDFSASGLKSDEIILSVLIKNDKEIRPGHYKEGTLLMDYHVGDNIVMKYRTDYKTDSKEYNDLKDQGAEYCYKTYKVKAIVYFPYLYDCTFTSFPLLITDDKNMQQLCPDSHIQQICLDGKKTLDETGQKKLERDLIILGNQSENISTRSLIDDIEENRMLYQKQLVYIIGIAFVALVLVLINIITNMKYRMVIRTREVSMLRAIGMSIKMVRKITIFENITLCFVGCVLSYAFLQPVLRYLYHDSDMELFGHLFHFDYSAFGTISLSAMILCALMSGFMTENWKNGQIVKNMEIVE